MGSTFYFCNGATASSVHELIAVLEHLDEATFQYHCNKQKNDFYNWLNGGLEEKKLAKNIKSVKTRKTMIKKLKA